MRGIGTRKKFVSLSWNCAPDALTIHFSKRYWMTVAVLGHIFVNADGGRGISSDGIGQSYHMDGSACSMGPPGMVGAAQNWQILSF